jgi:hypothetical protein
VILLYNRSIYISKISLHLIDILSHGSNPTNTPNSHAGIAKPIVVPKGGKPLGVAKRKATRKAALEFIE